LPFAFCLLPFAICLLFLLPPQEPPLHAANAESVPVAKQKNDKTKPTESFALRAHDRSARTIPWKYLAVPKE
jgi:hypothetical protein